MIAIDLKTLINKLDSNCRKALEAAIGTAVTRNNYNVENEHWLLNLLEEQEVDVDSLRQDLQNNIERFKAGSGRTPGLAPSLVDLMRNSWLLASLTFKASTVTSAHILYTILNEQDTLGQRQKISAELNKLDLAKLREQIQQFTAGEAKDGATPAAKNSISSEDSQEALNKFTVDITEQARQGKIDPIMGRDNEIRQMIDILTRRRQNNPILTGEAGVGKTAIVEGLAQRIVKGDVPPAIRNVSLRYLDLAAIQAGAGVKGEFEKRLKSVIDAVQTSPQPIIIFIDEAHNLMGAGGQAGSGDAANLLKPALARGELRTIAATTWAEYKKYIENDAALTRRFQVVKVDEPVESVAIDMMRGLVSPLEKHHNVRILDEAVVASVKLSSRYIPSRQLPDKSVSLLDTACARIRLSQTSTPPVVEDCEHRIEQTKLSIKFLEREQLTGTNHTEQLTALNKLLKDDQKQIEILKKNWQHEVELVNQIGQLRKDIESHAVDAAAKEKLAALQQELKKAMQKIKNAQGETPLIYDCVDAQIVAAVVSDWTGIPLGRMVRDEVATTLSLQAQLEERILGQTSAMHTLAQQLQIARAGLHDPNKPRGVFHFMAASKI
jgi:type VI secretion system protein VasG